MNYYNKKCLGCGQYFSKNIKDSSYVVNPNEKTLYCKRCFQLKNYGILDNSFVDNSLIENILNEIDFSLGSIILVVDLFDINSSLISKFKNTKNLLIVVNKSSFIVKSKNFNNKLLNIENYIRDLGWDQKIIFFDSIDKYKINEIDEWIKEQSLQKKKVYIAGNTNVGKSSLINALLQYNKKDPHLSVSSIKNTTLNLSKIYLDKFKVVIDTPGFLNENNFLSLISSSKKITFKKMILRSFQLKDSNQTFFVENIARIFVEKENDNEPCSIQFFLPENIVIHRTNAKNYVKISSKANEMFDVQLIKKDDWKKEKIKTHSNDLKITVFLNGIGFFILKNAKSFEIEIPKELKIETYNKSFI